MAPARKLGVILHPPCLPPYLPVCMLSRFNRVQLFVTLWTVARQAPPSMGFSRQEYWSGLPCPPPGDHLDPGMKHMSLTSPALAGKFFTLCLSAYLVLPRFYELCLYKNPNRAASLYLHSHLFRTKCSYIFCLGHFNSILTLLIDSTSFFPGTPLPRAARVSFGKEKSDHITLLFKNASWDFPGGPVVKNQPANTGDAGSIPPGPERFHIL